MVKLLKKGERERRTSNLENFDSGRNYKFPFRDSCMFLHSSLPVSTSEGSSCKGVYLGYTDLKNDLSLCY